MTNYKPSVPGLDRGFRVLEILADSKEGMTLSEISNSLNVPLNGVFRVIETLSHMGYISRVEKFYKVSPKILGLAYKAVNLSNSFSIIHPYIEDAVEYINETVLLGQVQGLKGIVTHQSVGGHPVKVSVTEGTQFNLHTSAPGKAILGSLSFKERKRIASRIEYVQTSENSIKNAEGLLKNISLQIQDGFFVDDEEDLMGIRCVGCPIFDHRNFPVYSLWTTGPSFRLSHEKIVEYGNYLKELCQNISKDLGATNGA